MSKKEMVLKLILYFLQDRRIFDYQRMNKICPTDKMDTIENDNERIGLLIQGLDIKPLIDTLGLSGWEFDTSKGTIPKEIFKWR